MNKTELIEEVRKQLGCTDEKSAKAAVNAVLDGIAKALADGESVQLIGFGSFSIKNRAARQGRNPKTGEPITIPESKVVVFKASKSFTL